MYCFGLEILIDITFESIAITMFEALCMFGCRSAIMRRLGNFVVRLLTNLCVVKVPTINNNLCWETSFNNGQLVLLNK